MINLLHGDRPEQMKTLEDMMTVKDLRKLLDGVPGNAVVHVAFEGAWGSAVMQESEGYDEKGETFTIGTY